MVTDTADSVRGIPASVVLSSEALAARHLLDGSVLLVTDLWFVAVASGTTGQQLRPSPAVADSGFGNAGATGTCGQAATLF